MINFVKMHGLGNDYVFVDCMRTPQIDPDDAPEIARRIADRHFGVGSDGLVLIMPSKIADAKMLMYNADGSQGLMCGNAIRCIGKYLYENGYAQKTDARTCKVAVETRVGVKTLLLYVRGETAYRVRVDIGLTIGHPHVVIFVADVDAVDVTANAKQFGDTNVEFAQIISPKRIKMRVHERGSGETMACGTGACAVAMEAVGQGLCPKNADITVAMRGGDLTVRVTDDTIYLTGGCQEVYRGIYP
jgi:carbamoyl-phosphate synthase large subunit